MVGNDDGRVRRPSCSESDGLNPPLPTFDAVDASRVKDVNSNEGYPTQIESEQVTDGKTSDLRVETPPDPRLKGREVVGLLLVGTAGGALLWVGAFYLARKLFVLAL
jgi:hypothetical protein